MVLTTRERHLHKGLNLVWFWAHIGLNHYAFAFWSKSAVKLLVRRVERMRGDLRLNQYGEQIETGKHDFTQLCLTNEPTDVDNASYCLP